jgi:hypothetical protein
MPFLQFLPWCPIDRAYDVGKITIVPFAVDSDTPDVGDVEARQVRSILSAYRRIDGHPVPKAALIRYDQRPILAEVSEDEMEVARELVELACISGLAKRALFDPFGPYCNADCFVWYGQRFQGKLDHVGIVHRRRGRRTLDVRSLDRAVFSIPLHVDSIRDVALDSSLLAALLKFKESAQANEWGRWQNAISCFKQANTDNEGMSQQVEWVLTCGAFERLLEAPSKAKEIAWLFSETLSPVKTISGDSRRLSSQQRTGSNSLRYEWMSEFYRIRGDFAHGKLRTGQPLIWTPSEHMVLASISFALCMKALLQLKGHYSLTDDDQTQTDALESLADQVEFLAEPPKSSGSGDSWWRRCLTEAKRARRLKKAIESFRALDRKGETSN